MTDLPTTPGGFRCILADPPWSFLTYGKKRTTPTSGTDDRPYVANAPARKGAVSPKGNR